MNSAGSALLGAFNGPAAPRADDLRRAGESQSRWRTCLVPADARTVIARAIADAYDAGFWHGGTIPVVPTYARALGAAAYERGRFDAITARASRTDSPDLASEPPAAD